MSRNRPYVSRIGARIGANNDELSRQITTTIIASLLSNNDRRRDGRPVAVCDPRPDILMVYSRTAREETRHCVCRSNSNESEATALYRMANQLS